MNGGDLRPPRSIVLLYNDRESERVSKIYDLLVARLRPHGLKPWMALRDITGQGSLFDQISRAIREAQGVVLFLGSHGLGAFQANVEYDAVMTQLWQRAAQYDRIVAHLEPGLDVPEGLLQWPSVNHQGRDSSDDAIASGIEQRLATRNLKNVLILCRSEDDATARRLAAQIRAQIAPDKYKVESIPASRGSETKIASGIAASYAVIVMTGQVGLDNEFDEIANGCIRASTMKRSDLSHVVVKGAESPVPSALQDWPVLEVDLSSRFAHSARRLLELIEIEPAWASTIRLDAGMNYLTERQSSELMKRRVREVAEALSTGKPLTIALSPYAGVESDPNGYCPSNVRARLLELIQDDELLRIPGLHPEDGAGGHTRPTLWQEQLATLCLLSGRSRDEIAQVVEDAIAGAPGDSAGPPTQLFQSIAQLARTLETAGLCRIEGLPAITVLGMCPGMRVERAFVAEGCSFERVSLYLDSSARPALHRCVYRPGEIQRRRAAFGDSSTLYLPEAKVLSEGAAVESVRLVKVFGSRDLGRGAPCGHFSECYDLLGHLSWLMAEFVQSVGRGPYLLLGGGLASPLVQAIHATLLRAEIEKAEMRPRLSIVPEHSWSPDPLRKVEEGRLDQVRRIENSGIDKLQVIGGEPADFVDALNRILDPRRHVPLNEAA